MKIKLSFFGITIPLALAVILSALTHSWLSGFAEDIQLQERVPGLDQVAVKQIAVNEPNFLDGTFVRLEGIPAEIPGSWPRFRGANSDAIYSDSQVTLSRNWEPGGLESLWAVDVGEGYAGPAIYAGRVYIIDYDRPNQSDVLRCLSLEDGRDIWSYSYPVRIKRNHGMSRTVPAVTEKYVVTMGPKCHLTCLDAKTGQFIWAKNLVREFNTKIPLWYAGQCPLLEKDRAIIAPGGIALMLAIDCATGNILWQTPNPRQWQMTHSSIIPMELSGHRMYVYCGSGGVVGISAENGKILWESTEWKLRTNVPSPVILDQGRIFLTAGYNAGSMMLQISQQENRLHAKPLFQLKAKVFGAEQQTPVFYNGHLYGIRADEQLVCLDVNGNIVWTSGSDNKFGLGPLLIANGLIYLMNDTGLLTLAEASPTGFHQLAQAQVLDGHESWAPMALVAGRLIVRDFTRMVCLNIRKK